MSTKDEIIKQNIAFMYGRDKSHAKHDPDKRVFVKSKSYIDPDAISNFTNEYACLDPSYSCSVCIPGEELSPYPSFEHALQAVKFPDLNIRSILRKCETIREAKKIVSKSNDYINSNWKDTIIINAEKLLRDKFIRNKQFRSVLMSTNRKEIIYANDHSDQYWGVSKPEGKGQNNLGKLLSKIRSEIDKGDDLPLWISSTASLYDESKLCIDLIVEKDGMRVDEDCRQFNRNKLMIGKDSEMCDIIGTHSSISRVHLVFLVDNQRGPMVIDLNSANGTTIDGNSLPPFVPTPINSSQTIRLGASLRLYKFNVDMNFHLKKREDLYIKMLDPDLLKSKETDKKELTAFVSNLPFDVLESDVYNFFSNCGTIDNLSFPKNKDTGQSKGIAFIVMENVQGFIQALSRNGELLLGRPIKVKKATDNDNEKKKASNRNDAGRHDSAPSYYQKNNIRDDNKRSKDRSRSRSRSRSRDRYSNDRSRR